MANLSDLIEEFIKALINEADGVAEIQRNELAQYFRCVPSQINYVLQTRFTNDHGYYTESKRGSGGKIVIKRINYKRPQDRYLHFLSVIKDEISQQGANILINNMVDYNMVNGKEANIMKAAISNKSLCQVEPIKRDMVRANLLKNIILSMMV